jgi:hypothetical protein
MPRYVSRKLSFSIERYRSEIVTLALDSVRSSPSMRSSPLACRQKTERQTIGWPRSQQETLNEVDRRGAMHHGAGRTSMLSM